MRAQIDTGGLLQFITGKKEQSPTVLLEYTLDQNIDKDRLQNALERALDVFALFKVRIVLTDQKMPLYEDNPNRPQVYEYDRQQHFFGKESEGYLFRLYYSEDKVILSAHHMLSDFHGLYNFMKCILGFYFEIDQSGLIDLDPSDTRDPYELFRSKEQPSLSRSGKWKNEIIIPHEMKFHRGERTDYSRLSFSLSEILSRTKKAESSVFPFFSWIISKAIAKEYDGKDLSILGCGGFDCRSIFGSKTPRCFSHSFITVLHPHEQNMDIEQQLTIQKARMFLELDEGTIANDIALRKESADTKMRQLDKFILDQDALDIKRKQASQQIAFFHSYTGSLDDAAGLARYIKDIDLHMAVTRNPIVAETYSRYDNIYCTLEETGVMRSIVPAMMEVADENGISCSLIGSGKLCVDTFPMEELFDD